MQKVGKHGDAVKNIKIDENSKLSLNPFRLFAYDRTDVPQYPNLLSLLIGNEVFELIREVDNAEWLYEGCFTSF